MTNSRDPNSVIYIGFWKRVLAYIIDYLVTFLPYGIVEVIFDGKIYFIILLLFSWAYTAGLHSSSWQATVGKRLLGFIVVDEYGDRLTLKRATCRFFAEILSTLLFFIGYIIVAFTKHKQGLHDKIAKTFVIKK